MVATADNVASSLRSGRLYPAVPHFKRYAKKMSINFAKLHESESVSLALDHPRPIRFLSALLADLGGEMIDDFVSFPREDAIPPWQAESFATVTFLKDGKDLHHYSDEDESTESPDCDQLTFACLFASIPSAQISRFLELIEHASTQLNARVFHRKREVTGDDLKAKFDGYIAEIASELAEDPGGELLAIIIAESYPRTTNA